ncbi:rhamnosyltransferase WsaF family glycosyltransferase [Paenibacillus sp. FSL R7-0179]|uniref:rhamnosyltransferase WsaF family glycosyltransferase n=1 Tax=Paenibacillus sp. FSL R7-0179 TaxID=2921672 RepID=UPI0030F7F087
MSRFIEYIARKAKNNKTIKKAYQSTVSSYLNTNIGEITPFNPRVSESNECRFNLLVPSINQEHLFGGISTALHFFNQLYDLEAQAKRRIITTDASPGNEDLIRFSDYTLAFSDLDTHEDSLITPFNDRYNKTIPIGKGDIFIATSWWTAYFAQRIVNWQSEMYNQPTKKIIYFIQDFEPGFYSWSSQYSLALSTYLYKGEQIAVFNSTLLKDFFNNHGFKFSEEYCFEPKLNNSLKQYMVPLHEMNKKKKILIYGRPSVARNAFTLIVETLRQWVWMQPDIAQWEIISAGEQHADLNIGNGMIIKSRGKMSLEDYAAELKESAVGFSLMISPHPSYPPLEMAHFGMLVLTNSYENKNLSKLHGNIFSLEDISPDNMAKELKRLCDLFAQNKLIGEAEEIGFYLDDQQQFGFIEQLLSSL